MSSPEKKAKQIASYYLFHKKIEFIFRKGLNKLYKYKEASIFKYIFTNDHINHIEDLYILSKDWIQRWKIYVKYENAKKYLDMISEDYNDEDKYKAEIEESCNNMILTGEINNNGNNFNQQNIESGFDKRNFIHKLILTLDDFDCLVDKDTYNSFFFEAKNEEPDITGFILDKMIILMIKSEKKMKFIIKDRTKDLLELTADFIVENGYKPNDLGVHFDYPEWRFTINYSIISTIFFFLIIYLHVKI